MFKVISIAYIDEGVLMGIMFMMGVGTHKINRSEEGGGSIVCERSQSNYSVI